METSIKMNMSSFNISSTPVTINTSPSPIDPTVRLTIFSAQIVVGAGSTLPNLILIILLLRTKSLRLSSGLIFGLALGDLSNGVAIFMGGATRLYVFLMGTIDETVYVIECYKRSITLWMLGCQLPSLMIIVLGADRVLAIVKYR